jgi:hypothetical protein
VGKKERFKSKLKDGSDSKRSNVAYSEDKIRYFFMDENKPNQSEFLKTLIEKSHRKNGSALKNIYATMNKKKCTVSRQKKSRSKKKQKKFIVLRENTDSKEDRREFQNTKAQSPPQFSVSNHKMIRGKLESSDTGGTDKLSQIQTSAKSVKDKPVLSKHQKHLHSKIRNSQELKYSFPLSTKTKDIKDGINLGYYFSGKFMKNKPKGYSSIKNPKSFNSVNFTENFFDPRQPQKQRLKTKLNTSNDRLNNSHIKNFSKNRLNSSSQKAHYKFNQDPNIQTPSNVGFNKTHRTSSIENSNIKQQHYLLSSFSRNKSGVKAAQYKNQTELQGSKKVRKNPKASLNYMSMNYSSNPMDNLHFNEERSKEKMSQIKSTLTPINRSEKKYQMQLFSESKKLQSQKEVKKKVKESAPYLGEESSSSVKNKENQGKKKNYRNILLKSRKEMKSVTLNDELVQPTSIKNEKKHKTLTIETTTKNVLHTINNNRNLNNFTKNEDSFTEEYMITQKENLEEKKKKNKINGYLKILEKKCGMNDKLIFQDSNSVREKVVSCFKNWTQKSHAEFFDFKSSKSLYKIKVTNLTS